MVKLSIDKDKIHAMAHTTKQQLDERDIKRPGDKRVSFNTCLQIVSQSLFSKPYEEVIRTYLDAIPQNR